MTSASLSQISYSITKHTGNLKELVKGPGFNPEWVEKLLNNPKKAKSFTGNFAVTYHFRTTGHRGSVQDYGIRLWHSSVKPDDLERYRRLNGELEVLNKKSPKYIRFAPMELFEPEENGFLVKNKRHPCLKMEWQNAENLDIFIDRIMQDRTINFKAKASLFRDIKQKIIETGEVLYSSRCSHGDLSSGNLMLSQKEDKSIMVHVIDFDSFYSQTLSTLAPSSIGHEDWQHPGYISGKLNLFGMPADYCALLCLMITLEALATDQALYDQFSPPSQDGSGILIRRKDLAKPTESPLIKQLLDLNNSLLTTHIDDLLYFLQNSSAGKISRPKSLMKVGHNVSRPAVAAFISQRKISKPKKVEKSWDLRKKIQSETDLIAALEKGATQMMIHKALSNRSFQTKFGKKSMLKFYETVKEHYGGLNECEEDIQTQYVWALRNAGETEGARRIADELYEVNPGNANIAYIKFENLRRRKKWKELLVATNRTLDLTPTNANVNKFHSLALLKHHKLSVKEAYADSRVRLNDDWKIICELINTCAYQKQPEEALLIEAMGILMETSNQEGFTKSIKFKSKIVADSIMNFLSMAVHFNQNLSKSILLIDPKCMRACKELPPNLEKRVQEFLEQSEESDSLKGMEDKSASEIYHLCEVLSLLSMWGSGDPNPKLANQLQLLVAHCAWHSEDRLAVGLTFCTDYGGDMMMVFTPRGWAKSKDRTPWDVQSGNIW